MPKPPKRFRKFTEDFPAVAKAYEQIGDAVHTAVHTHVRKALEGG